MENKHLMWLIGGLGLLCMAVAFADGEIWEESDHEVLIRSERGAMSRGLAVGRRGRRKPLDTSRKTQRGVAPRWASQQQAPKERGLTGANLPSSRLGHSTPLHTENCRYTKGAWSECDSKTNVRARTLTLKKGDPTSCERTKTIQKKCKKACRYEKSSWSECSPIGEMSRTDMLKANSDPTCEQSRRITKKCNKNKQVKASKDKGRRNRQ